MSCYNGSRLIQTGLHPGLHAQVPPLEAGEMEQAGPLRWPERVHTQLHRERWDIKTSNVGFNSQQYPFRFSSRVDHLSEYWRSTSGLKFWKLSLLEGIFDVPHRFTLTGLVLSATKESSLSNGKPSRYLRMPLLLITWHAAMSTPTLSVISRANYWPLFPPFIGSMRVKVCVCFRPFLRAGWGGFCPDIPQWAQHGQVPSVCLRWWVPENSFVWKILSP